MLTFFIIKVLNPTGVSKNHFDLQSDFKGSPGRDRLSLAVEILHFYTRYAP